MELEKATRDNTQRIRVTVDLSLFVYHTHLENTIFDYQQWSNDFDH